MTIRELQEENAAWARYNFPDSCALPHRPLLGIVEEVGELAEVPGYENDPHITYLAQAIGKLAHSRLKREQNIRVGEQHVKAAQDAVADIAIFLVHYCETEGWDAQSIVEEVWAKVAKRDWQKDRVAAQALDDQLTDHFELESEQ